MAPKPHKNTLQIPTSFIQAKKHTLYFLAHIQKIFFCAVTNTLIVHLLLVAEAFKQTP